MSKGLGQKQLIGHPKIANQEENEMIDTECDIGGEEKTRAKPAMFGQPDDSTDADKQVNNSSDQSNFANQVILGEFQQLSAFYGSRQGYERA